jgi:uncharacterized Rmd1/YagE family protein
MHKALSLFRTSASAAGRCAPVSSQYAAASARNHTYPSSYITSARSFATTRKCYDDAAASNLATDKLEPAHGAVKRKAARASSLRRVAVEAERSRDASKGGIATTRPSEHETETRLVTAYCAAEQYDIAKVAKILDGVGYNLDPYKTGLYPQVVHFQHKPGAGDILVFPSGTVVAWDVAEETVMALVTKGLLSAAVNPHLSVLETEDLEYTEDPTTDKSTIVNERIKLGTGTDEAGTPENAAANSNAADQADLTLAKIAFSSGLARSAKLAVLETALDRYFESTRTIPSLLSAGSKLPFTRSFILRKTGELLHVRAQLNLYSELTDSLPDLFWESKHELGLEGYFDRVGRVLDVTIRIRTLNDKIDYANEIASVLREKLSEKHGLFLEWLIIALIAIEVVYGSIHVYKDFAQKDDRESTERLLRQYLEKQLKEDLP